MVNMFPVMVTAISAADIAINAVVVWFNMMSCLLRIFLLSEFDLKMNTY